MANTQVGQVARVGYNAIARTLGNRAGTRAGIRRVAFNATTAFTAPLLLWFVSAAWGVWIAYDRAAAWNRFGLILAGLVVYAVLARIPERIWITQDLETPVFRWILASLPVLVTLYFLLTNDWSARLGKVIWLDPAMRWFASWQPDWSAIRLNSNSVGGILAMLIPLQVAAWLKASPHTRIWLGIPLTGLALIGLALSASRGGWAALALVTAASTLSSAIARLVQRRGASPSGARAAATGAVVIMLAIAAACLVLTPWGERLLAIRSDRLDVWRNSLDLASDYAFTGLGLDNFTMPYSSYALLVHVPHTIHAHNLFLDVWLNQGLLGLLALAGLLAQAMWPQTTWGWRAAGLAALAVLLLHGLLDDAFYGYGGRAIPFLLVPFAVLGRPEATVRVTPTLGVWCVALCAIGLAVLTPQTRGAIQANRGALAQTQAELTLYSNAKWGLQDALRRSPKLDLAPAVNHYQAALALDPANATANQRLGQIELSRGHYEAACQHVQAALDAAPHRRATRQMAGECLALSGDTARATALWRTVGLNEGQLEIRYGWHDYLGEKELAAKIGQAAQGLKTQP